MAISAGLVKELRERTAAGMMACKKALIETEGDLERAVELLREIGAASVERRAERIATEGVVGQLVDKDGRRGVVVEVNCETDFVAKGESFREFVLNVANCVLDNEPATLESLAQLSLGTGTIESARQDLIAQIGENVSIRRFERLHIKPIPGGRVKSVPQELDSNPSRIILLSDALIQRQGWATSEFHSTGRISCCRI